MTVWIVVWLALSCPGGWLKGLIPGNLKPLICHSAPAFQLYKDKEKALLKLKEQGAGSSIFMCRESRDNIECLPIPVRWEPVVTGEL